MKFLIITILDLFIIGLFLYSKLTPHKARLADGYLKAFNFFDRLFNPILNFLRRFFQPTKIGIGLAVDMSQIVLLVLFLLIQKFVL